MKQQMRQEIEQLRQEANERTETLEKKLSSMKERLKSAEQQQTTKVKKNVKVKEVKVNGGKCVAQLKEKWVTNDLEVTEPLCGNHEDLNFFTVFKSSDFTCMRRGSMSTAQRFP